MLKRLLSMLPAAVCTLLMVCLLLPMLASCNTSEPNTSAGTTDLTEAPKQTVEIPSVIIEKDYKQVALNYVKQMIDQYFDVRGGTLKTTPGGGQAVLWGVGAFAEALTEAYRLAPEDTTIRNAYETMLNVTIQKYRATLTVSRKEQYIYYNASAGNTGDYYYDDDEWIALVYMEAYQMTGNQQYLTWAEEILELLWYGWDEENGGGIHWKCDHSGQTTCSNGPAVVAYCIHYQLTQNATSLERAKLVYEWTREAMLENNLYKDSKGNNWKANYNQGTMIYGGSLLYTITGDQAYFDNTKATVRASFGSAFKVAGRKEYSDFDNDIENPWMNGWYVRGLMAYFAIDPEKKTTYLEAAALVMETALSKQQSNGYIPVDFGTSNPSNIDYDITKQGGIPTLFALLATWQQTWNGVEY